MEKALACVVAVVLGLPILGMCFVMMASLTAEILPEAAERIRDAVTYFKGLPSYDELLEENQKLKKLLGEIQKARDRVGGG